jgi:hypothetical protein
VLHGIPGGPQQQRPRAPILVRHPASVPGTSNTPALRLRSENQHGEQRTLGMTLPASWSLRLDRGEA